MTDLLIISASVSGIVLLIFALMPILDRRYSAVWKYYVWLILSVRLLIPFRLEIPDAPIKLTTPPAGTFVSRTDTAVPIEYYSDDSYKEKGNDAIDSANYAPIITVSQLVLFVWRLGAAIVLLYHIGSYIMFKRKIKHHMKKKDDGVYLCGCIRTPMMIGFFKPIILLPDKACSDDELEVIMKHEMTHWKRHDIWYKLLLLLAVSVHWFNPIIHLMIRRANRDLEYSCDDIVIRGMDSEYKKNYALTILKTMKGE